MKLEAIIICINYSDFLETTLPYNKKHFDNVIVVTDTKDIETFNVCKKNNVTCIQTDVFYRDGKIANKALGINEGLKFLQKDGWVVQLDADIWLPPFVKRMLDYLILDETCIYGIDRLMCESYEEWESFVKTNSNNVHDKWKLKLTHFPVGDRVVQLNEKGYFPIGFFQLWNPKGSGIDAYPVEIVGFDRTDVLHAMQFAKDKRRFIPELVCVHLASEETFLGQNWNGRTSIKFEPAINRTDMKREIFVGVSKLKDNYFN